MAERLVTAASQFILIALDGQSQQQVYCVVSITRNYNTNVVDSSSICNPAAKSPGTQDFSVDVALQRAWEPVNTHYSEKFLHDAFNNKSQIDYTVGPATPVHGDIVETGTGFITKMTKADTKDNVGAMDITITCTAAPVIIVEP
jgi:hypothetical protein